MQPIVMAKLKQIIVPFIAGAIGLFFYITRFPEKVFKAGSVDIVGASHQVSSASKHAELDLNRIEKTFNRTYAQ